MIIEKPVEAVLSINAKSGANTASDMSTMIKPTQKVTKISEQRAAQVQAEVNRYTGGEGNPVVDIKGFDAFASLNKTEEDFEADRALNDRKRNAISKQNDEPGVRSEVNDDIIKAFGADPDSGTGEMIRKCIPCSGRPINLDEIQFSDPFVATMEDMKNKLERLRRQMKALEFGDQFEQDFCDLLTELNSQCLPDLFGMISMFGVLMSQYTGALDLSLSGALNSIIAPFLSPIIGPFVTDLEKYVDMIVAPMECVVNSLEEQMLKLDVLGAVDKVKEQQRSFDKKKIAFYKRKDKALNRRKADIGAIKQKKELSLSTVTDLYPRYPSAVPFSGKYDEDKNEFIGGAEVDLGSQATAVEVASRDLGLKPGFIRQSLAKEKETIEKDIRKNQAKIDKLTTKFKESDPIKLQGAREIKSATDAREALEKSKNAVKSMFSGLTKGLNQSIQIVRDNLNMYRVELERTITGRIQTQEDQVELAKAIQKIQRWVSIVDAIGRLKSTGDLFDKCNGEDPNAAIGSFVSSFKEGDNSNQDWYQGTDADGSPIMIVAPAGSTLNVTSVDFEEIRGDELFGEATIGTGEDGDIQKTATYNDLNEADKLNRKGVLLDIGSIKDKEITLKVDDASSRNEEEDYNAKYSYVIIKNNFCSKSALNFGSSDTVRKWTEQL